MENNRLFPTNKGTPQGGIISPTIMNMVLDGLENELKKHFPRWKGQKVNFIRYTDDSQGFDFLSQNIRKFKGKLLIRPSKEAVQGFKDKIKSLIKNNRGIPAHGLIRILNRVIRGWSNYHKGICAKKVFGKLGTFIFWQLKRWAKDQHGNHNRWWIFRRYFTNNHFTDTRESKKGIQYYRLYRISYVPIRYHIKIKSKANPYLAEYDKYFSQRQKWREDLAQGCRQMTTFVKKETNNNSRVTRERVSLRSA